MSANPFETIDRSIRAQAGRTDAVAADLLMLCDRIGPRPAGSDGYRRAAEYMRDRFRHWRLDRAELEPFPFTAWRATAPPRLLLREPFEATLACCALPYGATTGPEGITAPVADVGKGGPAEFAAVGEVAGRWVLVHGGGGPRQEAYQRCVERGAAGLVLANPTPGELLVTGSVAHGVPGAIPAVSISCEGALRIGRLAPDGGAVLHLVAESRCQASTSWNVVGELTGTDFPDELVIIGGHLDSHDIGPGAFDNAAGTVLVMETARLLSQQRQHLRRTVRFIGFGGEEMGLLGSTFHAETHAEQLQRARFMMNCDTPSLGQPRGLAFHGCPAGEAYVATMSKQLEIPLVCQTRRGRFSDHYPFILQGLPTAGVGGGRFAPAVTHFLHMAADTPDKVSVTDLADVAGFLACFLLRASSDDNWPDMRRSEEDIASWRAPA